jgi:hypothetical protein
MMGTLEPTRSFGPAALWGAGLVIERGMCQW